MAKKQTFTSKLSKQGSNFKYVKHIKSVVSEDTGHVKFLDNMVRLDENENLDQALKRMEEESKQVLLQDIFNTDRKIMMTETKLR